MFLGDWHAGLPVRVSRHFPFTVTDEDGKQVTHHGAIIEGTLFCSQEAYDQIKAYAAKKSIPERTP